MALEFSAAGRFGAISLDAQDIRSIQNASNRDHIGSMFSRTWDKIADWFCGTDREEAKKCLFDLYSERTPHKQKVEAFLALRDMAGAVRVVQDIDMLDRGSPEDIDRAKARAEKDRPMRLDAVLQNPFCCKSQETSMELRILDDEPRARIELISARSLGSRDISGIPQG